MFARLFARRPALPTPIDQALAAQSAAALYRALTENPPPKAEWAALPPRLLAVAQQLDWPQKERDKLAVYLDFAQGQPARAFQRLIDQPLASDDFALLATACQHCQAAGRLPEAYRLIQQFDAGALDEQERAHFAALAGFVALNGGGGLEEALTYFDQAFASGHSDKRLLINAYAVYFEAGRFSEVRTLGRLLHEQFGQDAEARYALGFVELARGFYPEGFRLIEARYALAWADEIFTPGLLARPRWQGESLTGLRLLVHGEQGLGDLLMMARFVPQLCAQAQEVIIDCRPPAVTLMEHNFPTCRVIGSTAGQMPQADFDLWTGAMSLPHCLSVTAQNLPARAGYLTVPPEAQAYWRARLDELAPHGQPRIGLAWSGNPRHPANRRRSLPFDLLAEHLQRWPQVRFYALQLDVPAQRPAHLLDLSSELLTLADTAAVIEAMALVITTDTSVAHLAGALGKETWLLVPPRWEWRWGLAGESTPWYDALRVLRQPKVGDWSALLDQVFGCRLPAHLAQQDMAGL